MVRHNMNRPGKSLGVIGLGGLGHLAVKFGKAFGLRVTVFSTSITKKDEALNLLGADHFVISSDEKEMKVKSYHPTFERGARSLVPWLIEIIYHLGAGYGKITRFRHKHSIRRYIFRFILVTVEDHGRACFGRIPKRSEVPSGKPELRYDLAWLTTSALDLHY